MKRDSSRPTSDYVAGVWNTYPKSHIMLLDIMRLALLRSEHSSISGLARRASDLAAAIVASIPYHFTLDVGEYLQRVNAGM
jgi:hypothetical protein